MRGMHRAGPQEPAAITSVTTAMATEMNTPHDAPRVEEGGRRVVSRSPEPMPCWYVAPISALLLTRPGASPRQAGKLGRNPLEEGQRCLCTHVASSSRSPG